MKQEMYDSMYRTERYHWWFHGKRELVLALAAPYLSALPAPHIIDFGCGCGAMLEALSPFGTVTGADFSPLALDYCRKRFPCELRQLDLSLPSVPNARFDFGVALDVLEHIENDLTAAKNIFSCLRPGGTCIITVPAYQWLWSAHDENCMHKRRYDRRTLQSLLLRSGFEIEFLSYYNALLFPAAAAVRLLSRCLHTDRESSLEKRLSGFSRQPPVISYFPLGKRGSRQGKDLSLRPVADRRGKTPRIKSTLSCVPASHCRFASGTVNPRYYAL